MKTKRNYMKILTTLSYYRPYVSGISIYVQRMVEGLSKRDFEFAVLTGRHDKSLAKTEKKGKISILRQQVIFTLGKVPIMPGYLFSLIREMRRADLVWIHLPQAEGLVAALAAKLFGKRTVATLHCLPLLANGWQRILFQRAFDLINNLVIFLADRAVYYTKDYAENTKELWHFPKKSSYILPPIPEVKGRRKKEEGKRRGDSLIIGFAGRVAEDKGVEYLIKALQLIKLGGKDVKLIIAGSRDAVGESRYSKKIFGLIDESGIDTKFLGLISPDKMDKFYSSIDVLALPSVNRTESFGIVQVEAMKHGVPVVAADLPGVRVPVRITKMGKLAKSKDVGSLAKAILTIGNNKWSKRKINMAAKVFSKKESISGYAKLFKSI